VHVLDVVSIDPASIYRLQQSDGSAYQMSTTPPYNWTQLPDFTLAPSCAA
jgi:hypothetical protein